MTDNNIETKSIDDLSSQQKIGLLHDALVADAGYRNFADALATQAASDDGRHDGRWSVRMRDGIRLSGVLTISGGRAYVD